VYLSTYAWVLCELGQQPEVCIEGSYNPRVEHGVDALHGPTVDVTPLRIETSGCQTLRELIRRTQQVVTEGYDQSIVPDRFATVPPELRGTIFNFVPAAFSKPTEIPGLTMKVSQQPIRQFSRNWELNMIIAELPAATYLNILCNSLLYPPETARQIADRCIAVLTSAE
jgi:hypothetical protein